MHAEWGKKNDGFYTCKISFGTSHLDHKPPPPPPPPPYVCIGRPCTFVTFFCLVYWSLEKKKRHKRHQITTVNYALRWYSKQYILMIDLQLQVHGLGKHRSGYRGCTGLYGLARCMDYESTCTPLATPLLEGTNTRRSYIP